MPHHSLSHHPLSVVGLASAYVLVLSVTAAVAANETWVSGTGTDAGACPVTAPCRTFAFAHSQTSNNGAINVLTSGNFGPVTITKPISIVADGVEAVITAALGTAGINVQTATGAVVSLRGLTIDMRGAGNIGIRSDSGAALHVQDCVIRKVTNGVRFARNAGTGELYVSNTLITDSSFDAIFVETSGSGAVTAALDRVRLENSSLRGLALGASGLAIKATVRDSVVAGNDIGIIVQAVPAAINLMIERTALVNNTSFGVQANGASATVRMGDSTLTGNGTATDSGAGTIFSYGTNQINGNGIDTTPPIIPMK